MLLTLATSYSFWMSVTLFIAQNNWVGLVKLYLTCFSLSRCANFHCEWNAIACPRFAKRESCTDSQNSGFMPSGTMSRIWKTCTVGLAFCFRTLKNCVLDCKIKILVWAPASYTTAQASHPCLCIATLCPWSVRVWVNFELEACS